MPRFDPGALTKAEAKDVVAYVTEDIEHPSSPGGLGLGGVGPVAEGFIGLFIGVGVCMLIALWIGERTEREDEEDEHEHDDGARGRPCLIARASNGRRDAGPHRRAAVRGSGEEPRSRREDDRRALPLVRCVLRRVRRRVLAEREQLLARRHARSRHGILRRWLRRLGQVPHAARSVRRAAGDDDDDAEERKALIDDFASRGKVAIHRRGFLVKVMGAAGAVFGVVALFPLVRSLGPLPKKSLYTTTWRKGSYLTTVDGKRVHVERRRSRRDHHGLSRKTTSGERSPRRS